MGDLKPHFLCLISGPAKIVPIDFCIILKVCPGSLIGAQFEAPYKLQNKKKSAHKDIRKSY